MLDLWSLSVNQLTNLAFDRYSLFSYWPATYISRYIYEQLISSLSAVFTCSSKDLRHWGRLMFDVLQVDFTTTFMYWHASIHYNTVVYKPRLRHQHRAPGYLADYCVPVSEVPGCQHLWSARRHQLLVPRVRRGTFGTRAFSVAAPTVWNSLPDCLRDPAVDSERFRRDLKTYLFAGHLRR